VGLPVLESHVKSARAAQIAIDARPPGPHGPLAAEFVLGRPVLGHLIDLASELSAPGERVLVHARGKEHERLRAFLSASQRGDVEFSSAAPATGSVVLRTDRLYDPNRLKRCVRRGRPAESAVIWRLDRLEQLQSAAAELTRRLTYQPLGRYWAFPLARRLAEVLCPTRVHPNALTLATGALMLAAAGINAIGSTSWTSCVTVAALLATGLVLDTADGRLARLQGTSSALGRWLDEVLDELADLALHAAVAWAAFTRTGLAAWMALGMLYVSGKYLFMVQSLAASGLDCGVHEPAELTEHTELKGRIARLGDLVRAIGHADLRWHLWIALALLGRLDVALLVYAVYFPARALAGAVRKAVRYA
jgi:phosphatidylglycerophosphate synthase